MAARYKNFEATGLALLGRLYAGDLNAIQDYLAALYDLTQSLGVSQVTIGESGLILMHYGSGEARLTGALRTDGILRGLGGIIPGAFTNTTRDAIPVGQAPYGVAILNSELNLWQWNAGTDGARNWQPLGGVASAVAGNGLGYSGGVLSVNVDGVTIEISSDAIRVKAGSIDYAHLAANVKPTGSAAPGDEALRALGTSADKAAAGNDPRIVSPLRPHFRAHKSAAFTFPSSGWQTLTWEVEDFDTDAMFTVAANDRFTCKTAGCYLVMVRINYSDGARDSSVGIRLRRNGAVDYEVRQHAAAATGTGGMQYQELMHMAVNDYFQAEALAPSGSPLIPSDCSISAIWMSANS